jgi:16S rRNA (cytosine967-C5)-methyltransferase
MKARFTPALFAHAEAVFGQLLRFDYPADAVVSRYFRDHRELGHADRAFVAETVFAVLRRGRSLEARCAGQLSDRRLLLAPLPLLGWSQRELAPVLKASEEEWLAAAKAMSDADLPPAVRCDLPDWLYNALEAQFGAEEVIKLAQGLNQPAPLDLRVNTVKTNRDAVIAQFASEDIAAVPGPLSPTGRSPARQAGTGQIPAFPERRF